MIELTAKGKALLSKYSALLDKALAPVHISRNLPRGPLDTMDTRVVANRNTGGARIQFVIVRYGLEPKQVRHALNGVLEVASILAGPNYMTIVVRPLPEDRATLDLEVLTTC